jgi:hypothetical protein
MTGSARGGAGALPVLAVDCSRLIRHPQHVGEVLDREDPRVFCRGAARQAVPLLFLRWTREFSEGARASRPCKVVYWADTTRGVEERNVGPSQ